MSASAALHTVPRLAGYCDRATINGGKLYLYGDLDPALPGGADARWGIRDSGVYDRLGASMLPRPDPLGKLTPGDRDRLKVHWGGFLPEGGPGVLVTSLTVSAVELTPGAAWLGA